MMIVFEFERWRRDIPLDSFSISGPETTKFVETSVCPSPIFKFLPSEHRSWIMVIHQTVIFELDHE
jgi:hypothetical protein